MMLGTYGANTKDSAKVAQERAERIDTKREDLARRLEALKGGAR